MVDGLGVGFASTLIDAENSGYTRAQIESLMYSYNGLDRLAVMQRINIEYTGHVDLWTKILNDTLVMVGEYAPGHQNYALLNQHADSIRRCKNGEGYNFRVVRIPMPWSTSSAPPTYLNSLFVNNSVLVPTWGLPEDTTGLRVYRQCLPGYNVVGIDCSVMSGSGGAVHCITMQIPSTRFLQISHRRLPNTNDTIRPYRVRGQIATSASLIPESTLISYRINSGPFTNTPLTAVIDTQGVYVGYIPARRPGDTVYYYLLSRNGHNVRQTSPRHVPPQIYSFVVTGGSAVRELPVSQLRSLKVWPNPCKGYMCFSLSPSNRARVRIDIYNSIGQVVKTIFTHVKNSGPLDIKLALTDQHGGILCRGVYFFNVTIGAESYSGKFIAVR